MSADSTEQPRPAVLIDGLSMSRRAFVSGAATTVALPMMAAGAAEQAHSVPRADAGAADFMPLTLRINGQSRHLNIDSRTSLLDALRDQLGLHGTKKGCDHGQCGACTVHVDGNRVLACLTFAAMTEGREVTTIEGLATPAGKLHPMQQAFIDHDGFQCGYCTPGQIMSAIACVREGKADSDAQIREYMSGNLCRCAAYPNIVDAVKQGRDTMGST